MNKLKTILSVCILIGVSQGVVASTFSFDGLLTIYDSSGGSSGSTTATGVIDFDPVSGT